MDLNEDLMQKILKQLEDAYPDSINSANDILPEFKALEERKEIRKQIFLLKIKGKVSFDPVDVSRDSDFIQYNIKLNR